MESLKELKKVCEADKPIYCSLNNKRILSVDFNSYSPKYNLLLVLYENAMVKAYCNIHYIEILDK